jgi:pimeloyl-ACP methyl ester carboxylesterase
MFNLVQTTTKDNLTLHGLLLDGDKKKPAVIYIHGFEGDFFTNRFVPAIANKLQEQGIAFLTVQTRGMANDYLYKLTDESWKRFGAHFELLEDAYKDIDAWIEFLMTQGYENVILQGHSLGTMKSVRYLFEGGHADKVKKLILLAPFDIIQLLEDATKGKWPEYLEIAKQKVKEGRGEELVPKEYLDVEMSYQTYVSHHQRNDFEYIFAFHNKSYDFPLLKKVNIPVKAIVGTKDQFFHPANPSQPLEAMDMLKQNIKQFAGALIKDAGHGYDGHEEEVATEVVNFLKE